MLTLAVTSSTAAVGVAIVSGDQPDDVQVLSSASISTDRRHAEEITPMIASALESAGTEIGDIDRFAVDVGPGRFTGLRVGITTVRTLALATDRRIVPVTSLETLANAWPGRVVTAVIDARRAEVFQQRFDSAGSIDAARFGPPEELAAAVQPGDLVVGDGADRYSESYTLPGAELIIGQEPDPVVLARLSTGREAVAGPRVTPLYLRDPDVQINIKTRHNT